MFKRIGIAVGGAGVLGFMLIYVLVSRAPQRGESFQWPMMAAVFSMAIGMVMFDVGSTLERRAQALATLNR